MCDAALVCQLQWFVGVGFWRGFFGGATILTKGPRLQKSDKRRTGVIRRILGLSQAIQHLITRRPIPRLFKNEKTHMAFEALEKSGPQLKFLLKTRESLIQIWPS